MFVGVQNGQLKAVVGASGGSMIIAGTTEVFLNHFGKGMDPLSSVFAPRSYHQVFLYKFYIYKFGFVFKVRWRLSNMISLLSLLLLLLLCS